ncbi:MAG: dTMP kinase [Pseudomonadota bacterium]|nr:MAG: dTMP kinase [Pseudomonadota bacterium]
MTERGRFITLEGGEGAGKSTAMAVIGEWLEASGRTVVRTREPGGPAAAERIRALLLDPDTGEIAALTELLLMFAARNENLERVIRPALAAGKDVLSDRFTDASMAYQGGGRQLGGGPVKVLEQLVQGDLRPDLTLLLDVPVEVGLRRIHSRAAGPDRMEQNRPEFLERVRQAYLEQARHHPQRMVVIDASCPLNAVRRQIIDALEERLG